MDINQVRSAWLKSFWAFPLNAIFLALLLLFVPVFHGTASASEAPRIQPPTAMPRVWSRSEFALRGIPVASNPYDPDLIAVDVTFKAPSGASLSIPAFWYQPYTRELTKKHGPIDSKTGLPTIKEVEKLTPAGDAGWRVRWTPLEKGMYQCAVVVTQNGSSATTPQAAIKVGAAEKGARGFVRVEPQSKRYFETSDGQPLLLLGENTCWPHQRGTYDYDDYFPHFQSAGMNYLRLWMWHNSLGIEFFANERLNYNQAHAWSLDYILDNAAAHGVYAMLCLDYHGIFQDKKDMWGGNDFWPKHAYNKLTGGPCATQNDFFTNTDAKILYKKRLRYLIARYGADSSLMSWEFFNEVDNDYSVLKPSDVVAWHAEMSQYVHDHDPYKHLMSTSLGSAGVQPELWKIPSIDYAMYHWYANWGGPYTQPAVMATDISEKYHRDFGKPFYIAEFGTSGLNDKFVEDPQHVGMRQAMWAAIVGGSAGTVMPWYWEATERDNLYPMWGSIHDFLTGAGFGTASWHPLTVTAPVESKALGDEDPDGKPFDETITLAQKWAAQPADPIVIRQAGDTDGMLPPGYIHGSSKLTLISPMKISVRTGAGAHMIMHLNSVSNDAILAVRTNGKEIFRRSLPNIDGKWLINNEYNIDIDVPLPAGVQDLQIFNPGGDWEYLDWVKIAGAMPSRALSMNGVPLNAWAMTGGKTTLLYALDPRYNWPRGSKSPQDTLKGAFADIHGLPDGRYHVAWWDTATGKPAGQQVAASHGGLMHLAVTPFQTDIAARLTRLNERL